MTSRETDKEDFLGRWSRRKREAEAQPPAPAQEAPVALDPDKAPELTPLDQLTGESDYRDFFHPKVDEDVRRSALKKLFSDPRYNIMDGLDTYIDDYSKSEPIPPEMLAGLVQAQKILKWASEKPGEHKFEDDAPEPPHAVEETEPALAASNSSSLPQAQEAAAASEPVPTDSAPTAPSAAEAGAVGPQGDAADETHRTS